LVKEIWVVKDLKTQARLMSVKTKKLMNKSKATKTDAKVVVKKVAEKLLKLMGTSAKISVSEDEENEAILIDLDTEEEAGLLIGVRGETLSSLQTIIGMIVRQKTGEWFRVLVNISDWRERQRERLESLARQAADRARDTGEPQFSLSSPTRIVMPALNSPSNTRSDSGSSSRR